MGSIIRFSSFEDEAILKLFKNFTDREVGEILQRSPNSIASRRMTLNLRKVEPYKREVEMMCYYQGWSALNGRDTPYWSDEQEIECSLNPIYNSKDLEGDEKLILNIPLREEWKLKK